MFRTSRKKSQAGFTLTELIASVLMLSVLVLSTLPRFAKASATDSIARCLENHKQLSSAWQQYASDNDGRLVNNYTISGTMATVSDKTFNTWANNIVDWSVTASNTNLDLVRSSRLFPYLQNDIRVFKCPADTYMSPIQIKAGWGMPRTRSYAMNGFMGAIDPFDKTQPTGINSFYSYRQFLKNSSIPNPAQIFILLEEHPDSLNDGFFITNPGATRSWDDFPASYHEGACGFSFADGHAEMHAWQGARTKVPVRFGFNSFPTIGPSESGDYKWVVQRMAVDVTTLGVRQAPSNQFEIVWSALPTNYVLEASDTLLPESWTNVAAEPVRDFGQKSVKIESQNPGAFFRLRRH